MPPSSISRAEFEALDRRVRAIEQWMPTTDARLTDAERAVVANAAAIGKTDEEVQELIRQVTARCSPPTDPPPVPPTPPVPPSPPITGYSLLAKFDMGTVANQSQFSRGGLAIDFSVNPHRMRMIGPTSGGRTVWDYSMPAEASWNPNTVIPVARTAVATGWWDTAGEGPNSIWGAGMVLWNGDWWIISKKEYDTTPPSTTTIWPESNPTGGAMVLPLDRQNYAGFIKGLPGTTPQIGGGGCQSGQGYSRGPSVADMDGTVHLKYGFGSTTFSDTTGTSTGTGRAPRTPNSYPINHVDFWGALEPQGGVGRWSQDMIYGGGLKIGTGINAEIWFFVWQGTGEISYNAQGILLTTGGLGYSQTMRYRYSATTYALIDYDYFLGTTSAITVMGQEQDSQGRIYLTIVPNGFNNSSVNYQVWVYGPTP